MTDIQRGATREQRDVIGKLGKNYFAVLAGNLFSRAISFGVVAYLARVLGPTAFGEWAWAQAVLVFGLLVADWGLQTQGIRQLAERPEDAHRTVSAYLGLRLVLGILAAIALAAFGYLAAPSRPIAHLTALYGVSLLATALLPEWIFIGTHRMGYVGLARVLQYACYAGMIFLGVHGPADVLAIPLANAAGITFAALLLFVLLRSRLAGWRPVIAPEVWRPIVAEATPLAVSYLVIQLYLAFPILLLGWLRGPSEMGYFNGPYRVLLVLGELLNLFLMALYPTVAERWSKDEATVGSLLGHVVRIVAIVTVPIALGGMVVAGPLLRLLFGAEFGPSVLTFQIIAWNVVLLGINGVYTQLVLLMHRRQKEFLAIVSVGAVVSLLVNAVLAARYGHNGVAVAWVISEGAVGVASYFMVRRFVTLPLARHFTKPFIGGGLMAAICWGLLSVGAPVAATIACGMVVYAVFLLLIGAVTPDEMALFRQLLRRSHEPAAEQAVEL